MHLTRIAPLSLFVALACPTDPGDVGSESASNSGSAEGDDAADDVADDDDGGSTGSATGSASATQSDDAASTDGEDGSSAVTLTDDGAPQPESSGGTGSSGDDASSESGTMVADCSECGPDEGCVAEVAFGTEYFCVPIPDACGVDFNCECAGDYCMEPFTLCQDLPDPPQRQIACECITC
jgi:hypothetical protein